MVRICVFAEASEIEGRTQSLAREFGPLRPVLEAQTHKHNQH